MSDAMISDATKTMHSLACPPDEPRTEGYDWPSMTLLEGEIIRRISRTLSGGRPSGPQPDGRPGATDYLKAIGSALLVWTVIGITIGEFARQQFDLPAGIGIPMLGTVVLIIGVRGGMNLHGLQGWRAGIRVFAASLAVASVIMALLAFNTSVL